MNLVLYTHPDFLGSLSQPRFARMLRDAYAERGHRVQLRQPVARVRRHIDRGSLAKWAGYVDQYLLFPSEERRRIAADSLDTLYVFCDQALGPWIPMAAHRPHVVHCHDLLALKSALGLVPENPTSATGRVYQRWIRGGFRRARNFISISEQSRSDLHRFGGVRPRLSEVVYNGLNHPYRRVSCGHAAATLRGAGLDVPTPGVLVHVSGGQWYKNATGVIQLYARYAALRHARGLPVQTLWMVSPREAAGVASALGAVPECGSIRFVRELPAPALEALYSIADALLFPSLAEGFGWPIAEALACGCPVLTTGEAPMTEVGGPHAHYLPRLERAFSSDAWAADGARVLMEIVARQPEERATSAEAGIEWARRFDARLAIEGYLRVYEQVLSQQ